jgi:protein-S-isoprenylcysteine O-methyltransferase Ste14
VDKSSAFRRETFEGLVFKYRGLLWGIFALAVLVCPASFSATRATLSIPFLISGQLLRFWAAGVIPKYRTLVVDAPILVTWGPYAWVRNPLYAGNALMGCGWSLLVGWWWTPAFAAAYLAIYMLVIIPCEERFLLDKFRDEYLDFRSATPALVPNLSKFRERARVMRPGLFDAKKSWSMERHSLGMNVLTTALILLRLLALDY